MIDPVSQLENTIGISVEMLTLVIIALGSLIFSAKDMRVGLIVATLLFAGAFIAFYQLGYEYIYAFVAFIFSMVILLISLFITYQKGRSVV